MLDQLLMLLMSDYLGSKWQNDLPLSISRPKTNYLLTLIISLHLLSAKPLSVFYGPSLLESLQHVVSRHRHGLCDAMVEEIIMYKRQCSVFVHKLM